MLVVFMINCAIFRLIADFISQHKSEIIAKGAAVFKLGTFLHYLVPEGKEHAHKYWSLTDFGDSRGTNVKRLKS